MSLQQTVKFLKISFQVFDVDRDVLIRHDNRLKGCHHYFIFKLLTLSAKWQTVLINVQTR
jgi:hypothetical protein